MSDESEKWKTMADALGEARAREIAVLAGEVRWGQWHYDKDRTSLIWEQDGNDRYEIDLRRCKDSATVLDWIVQVSEKSDANAEIVGNLVMALDELFHLQKAACGSGKNRKFKALDVLNREPIE